MQRKQFEAIAREIRAEVERTEKMQGDVVRSLVQTTLERIAHRMANVCQANAGAGGFDHARFMQACGIKQTTEN